MTEQPSDLDRLFDVQMLCIENQQNMAKGIGILAKQQALVNESLATLQDVLAEILDSLAALKAAAGIGDEP